MHRIRSLLICFYAFIRGFRKSASNNKTILLLFFGRIGDGVMFLDALEAYKELYSSTRGYNLILCCRNEVISLLRELKRDDSLPLVELDRDRLGSSLAYFTSKVRQLSSLQPSVILNVRENNAIENVFIHAIPAPEKIIYRSFHIEYDSFVKKYYSLHTYTKDYHSDEVCDQLTNFANLLRILGASEFVSKLPEIRVQSNVAEKLPKEYIAVCPGASSQSKCWPLERYAEVLDYYFENNNGAVVICGGTSDAAAADRIAAHMKKDIPIINQAGKTNMLEWIAIIQHAKLVVSNESASVHLAAATGVPSICIGEQTYGDMWLPYRPEYIRPEDQIPRVVRATTLDCFFCVKREFCMSPDCAVCIRENGVKKCIYDVSSKMVMNAVDEYNDTIKGVLTVENT